MKRILLLAVMAMFLIAPAFAFEFDNVKSDISKDARTITISNSILGIPTSKIGTLTLDSPNIVYVMPGENRKVAEFTISLESDSYDNFLKQIQLLNKQANNMEIQRNLKVKYKTTTYENVTDYKLECKGTGKYTEGKNSTEIQDCKQVTSGSHLNVIDTWTELPSKNIQKGMITIGLFAKVLPNDNVEWIPTIFGVKIDEWATWTSGFNVGLRAYYELTNGSCKINSANNLTKAGNVNFISNTSCLIGGCVYSSATDASTWLTTAAGADDVFNLTNVGTGQYTLNWWQKFSGTDLYVFIGKGSGTDGWSLYDNNGGNSIMYYPQAPSWASSPKIPRNSWQMVTLTVNATDVCFYVQGTIQNCKGAAYYDTATTNLFSIIGSEYQGGNSAVGYMDETSAWNRTLSATEVSDLYNGGAGMTWVDTAPVANLTIVLNSPADAMKSNDTTQTFNCTSSTTMATYTIKNMTLFVYLANGTINTNFTDTSALAVTTYQHVTTIKGLSEGTHKWTCDASDDANYTIVSNWTFTIDTTPPKISTRTPANGTQYVAFDNPYQAFFNFTSSDNGGAGVEKCWYYNETGNTTYTCNALFAVNFTSGWHTVKAYANDTVGNFNHIGNQTTFLVNYVNFTNIIYASPVVEATTNPITFNMTATYIAMGQMNATIWYNNTPLTTARYYDSFGFASATANATAPMVSADTNVSFHLNLTINGVNASRNGLGQIVQHLTAPTIINDTCPAGLNQSWYFSFAAEDNLTVLNSVNVFYNFKYGPLGNNALYTLNGTLTTITNLSICTNVTTLGNYSVSYGEIQYALAGYTDRRFYMFNGTQLTIIPRADVLYSLINSKATSFLFTFKDVYLTTYVGKYTKLLRWYPASDSYITVEMAKTDDKGQTIMRVKTEDVDYRVGLYEVDGTLINLANPVRFACLDSPCSYTMTVTPGSLAYDTFTNIQSSLTFNETTKVFTFIWNDPSGTTQYMNLNVTRLGGSSDLNVCNSSGAGSTGVLSCNISAYTSGNFEANAYRAASPLTAIAKLFVSLANTIFKGNVGLFISVLIFIVMILAGTFSPYAAIILGIVGLIPAALLGAINITIFIGFGVLGGILMHFFKRIS